jgi:hypothetical protein
LEDSYYANLITLVIIKQGAPFSKSEGTAQSNLLLKSKLPSDPAFFYFLVLPPMSALKKKNFFFLSLDSLKNLNRRVRYKKKILLRSGAQTTKRKQR